MARDQGLEQLIREGLGPLPHLTEQPMFGSWAWLLRGNLLCGARAGGLLFRLGAGEDEWALQYAGVIPMQSGKHVMRGWVRVSPEAGGGDALRRRLLDAALSFNRTLPAK